jgi:hypothetical protein
MALALERGFRFHYIRNLVPVSETAGLDCIEKKDFLFGGPSALENGLKDRFEDEEWMGPEMGLGFGSNGKAFKALIKSSTSRTFDIDLVRYIAVARRTGADARATGTWGFFCFEFFRGLVQCHRARPGFQWLT